MDALLLRFSRFFIKWRGVNLVLIGGATLFFAYHALQLQVFSQFIDLLPRNHPFIQIYEKYNRGFGSANVVVAAIVAKDGSIYDERVLEKVYAFTDQIDKIEGVDHGQVASMTAVTVRDTGIDQAGTISSTQVVGEEPLALLETQFFTRRTVQRAAKRGDPAPSDLAAFIGVREDAQGACSSRSSPPTPSSPRARPPATRPQIAKLTEVRRENAELEFLQLRLAELPPDYRLEGENLRGPDGTLLPKAMIADLPDRIHQNKQVYGRFVSKDDSAAMITAGFLESRLDYNKIFTEIHQLKNDLEADGLVTVHLTGQPILVGWTFFYKWEIVLILGLSLGILLLMLGVYFRRWYGVVMPFSGAIVCTVWGLGFTSLMGYQIEPLVLVIPMVITARAISHSVQFVERFYEEYERLNGDKEEAVVLSMAELLVPGFLGIVADAIGIIVIGVSSIALMKKVAIFGAFWSIAIIFTEMLLNRLMIMYLPAPRDTSHYVPTVIMCGAEAHRVRDHEPDLAEGHRRRLAGDRGAVRVGRAEGEDRRVASRHAGALARQRVQRVREGGRQQVLRLRRSGRRGRDRAAGRRAPRRRDARDRGLPALHGAGPEGRRLGLDRRLPEGDQPLVPQRRSALDRAFPYTARADRRPLVPVRGRLARSARAESVPRSGRPERDGAAVLPRPPGRDDPRRGAPRADLHRRATDLEVRDPRRGTARRSAGAHPLLARAAGAAARPGAGRARARRPGRVPEAGGHAARPAASRRPRTRPSAS